MVNLLSAPIRLLDTRLLSGKLPAGAVLVLQVTGVDVGGISVPKGATGVVGNVTVVQPTGGCVLRLYPGGAPLPATQLDLNFASGQVVANGVTVGLNTGGQISIKVDIARRNRDPRDLRCQRLRHVSAEIGIGGPEVCMPR